MSICLKNASVCDALQWNVLTDILIEDGIIAAMGCDLHGDETVDLHGRPLLPGLFDAHVHIVTGPGPFYEKALLDWAQAGVLTVRDLGLGNGKPADDYLPWRDGLKTPEHAAILTAGQCVAAWHGYMHKMGSTENGIGVKTPEEAAAAIRRQIAMGCEGVKCAMDYEMMDENTPQYTPETVRAIAETARQLGVWCTAHVQMSKFLRILVENGIPEMAHTVLDPIPDELLDEMIARGVAMTSTLQPINAPRPPLPQEELDKMPPAMREVIAKMEAIDTAQQERNAVDNIRRFHEKGGMVIMGTDTMRMEMQPGAAAVPIRELQLLAQAGLSVQEVIAACTLNAARACKVQSRLGSIEIGKQADLIALSELPDKDFRALENVGLVMHAGVIIKNS